MRDSDEPGTFWHYNVWAVNALSTIFENTTGMDQFEAFQDWIAGPIGMEDYRTGDGTLAYNALSQHPAGNFRISVSRGCGYGVRRLNHEWRESARKARKGERAFRGLRALSRLSCFGIPADRELCQRPIGAIDWQVESLNTLRRVITLREASVSSAVSVRSVIQQTPQIGALVTVG